MDQSENLQVINTELKKLLVIFGELIVIDAKKSLKVNKKNASYNLMNNIRYDVIEVNNSLELQIIMPDYGLYLIGGRAPGKTPPPVDPIVKWIKDKNLARKFLGIKGNKSPENPIYQDDLKFIAMKISRRIGKEGKKPFNFLAPASVKFLGANVQDVKLLLPLTYTDRIIKEYEKQTKTVVEGAVRKLIMDMNNI